MLVISFPFRFYINCCSLNECNLYLLTSHPPADMSQFYADTACSLCRKSSSSKDYISTLCSILTCSYHTPTYTKNASAQSRADITLAGQAALHGVSHFGSADEGSLWLRWYFFTPAFLLGCAGRGRFRVLAYSTSRLIVLILNPHHSISIPSISVSV